mmetsp:Transcript_4968/g.12160  ORF Transcript_4968/g.12160 Transcript_4968/m.12160 type:complete len:272 (+) Transcript_4968:333-1148(+)
MEGDATGKVGRESRRWQQHRGTDTGGVEDSVIVVFVVPPPGRNRRRCFGGPASDRPALPRRLSREGVGTHPAQSLRPAPARHHPARFRPAAPGPHHHRAPARARAQAPRPFCQGRLCPGGGPAPDRVPAAGGGRLAARVPAGPSHRAAKADGDRLVRVAGGGCRPRARVRPGEGAPPGIDGGQVGQRQQRQGQGQGQGQQRQQGQDHGSQTVRDQPTVAVFPVRAGMRVPPPHRRIVAGRVPLEGRKILRTGRDGNHPELPDLFDLPQRGL